MSFETIEGGDAVPNELVGSAVQRREDPHLITGDAEYTDDIKYPGEVHLALLGSQYGHARIEGIDTSAAEAMDGVLTTVTWADVEASMRAVGCSEAMIAGARAQYTVEMALESRGRVA